MLSHIFGVERIYMAVVVAEAAWPYFYRCDCLTLVLIYTPTSCLASAPAVRINLPMVCI